MWSSSIDSAATARMMNNGQSCIAAKRFILHEAIADQFEAGLMADKFRALTVGDPTDPATDGRPPGYPQHLRRAGPAGASLP
jgi:succinate-semialdehyde dehydrogenase/glutarate-semialdehyde dehydrogenase